MTPPSHPQPPLAGGRRFLLAAVAAIIIWRLKRYYADAAVDDLRWILDPTARLASVLTGARFEWESGQGYLSRERWFLIAKVCAGINFMIAAFGMTTWMLRRRVTSLAALGAVLVVSLLAAFSAAVLVNAARIAFAVWTLAHPAGVSWLTPAQAHRVEGIAFYFGGLLLLYGVLQRYERQSLATPLVWYYAITLALPVANGAAAASAFVEHALYVLAVPFLCMAIVALCMLSLHACTVSVEAPHWPWRRWPPFRAALPRLARRLPLSPRLSPHRSFSLAPRVSPARSFPPRRPPTSR